MRNRLSRETLALVAIAVVLLASTLVLLGVYNRFAGLDRLWG